MSHDPEQCLPTVRRWAAAETSQGDAIPDDPRLLQAVHEYLERIGIGPAAGSPPVAGALSRPGGRPGPMPRRPGACASGRALGQSAVGQLAAARRQRARALCGQSLGRLPDRARDRPGRHGHRLRGRPVVAGPPRGLEGAAVCGHVRRQASAALPPGGPGRRPAPSHQHRARLRRRLRARHPLLRHATHRRPVAGRGGPATSRHRRAWARWKPVRPDCRRPAAAANHGPRVAERPGAWNRRGRRCAVRARERNGAIMPAPR